MKPAQPNIASLLRILVILIIFTVGSPGQTANPATTPLLDSQGRQLIPGGFVTLENVTYTPADYQRMVRMGANFQVIRMPLGKIGGWPGMAADPDCLARFDAMVRMGRDAGLQTIFKLVVYGIQPFGDRQWDAIWHNTDNTQDTLLAAWTAIWTRYRDEPSVFGYDLLNEPQRGLDTNYDRCQRECLLPLLRRLADAMHTVSPDKWALYQPLMRKPEEQIRPGSNPFVAIDEPFERTRALYAPHLYQMDLTVIAPMLADYERQATLSNNPLILGEWGPPTHSDTDTNPVQQARYTKVYRKTANELDARQIGAIKAWFCGTTTHLTNKRSKDWFTWAIFSDNTPAGRVERQYITDVLARPRPLAVAGRIQQYGFDFDSATFELTFTPDPALGGTELFLPAERHYPTGLNIELGPNLTLTLAPNATQLDILHAATPADRQQATQIRWNRDTQHLVIEKWLANDSLTLKILPRHLN